MAAPVHAAPHSEAQAQHTSKTSLYLADLALGVTETELLEKFSTVGRVTSIKVVQGTNTRTGLSHAYVNFEEGAGAKRAIDTMNFDILKGQPMRISWNSDKIRSAVVLYIRNLDKSIDNRELYNIFSDFGAILSSKVAQKVDGISKGYGYVSFETEEEAMNAIQNINGMVLKGKKVIIERFASHHEREKKANTNLYVKNFDYDMTDDKLNDLFKKFGKITSAKVMYKEGFSMGFGFVNFSTPEEATKAMAEMNGKFIGGKPLYVALHQKKEERMRQAVHERTVDINRNVELMQNMQNMQNMQHIQQMQQMQHFLHIQNMQQMHQLSPGYFMPQGFSVPPPPLGWPSMGAAPPCPQQPDQHQVMMTASPGMVETPGMPGPGQEALDASMLAAAPPQQQKQILGERLFLLVQRMLPDRDLACKITGMLLDLDNAEVLHMLEDDDAFKSKFQEAVAVLQAASQERQKA